MNLDFYSSKLFVFRMKKCVVVYFLIIFVDFGLSQDTSEVTTEAKLKDGEKRMSEYVLQILQHYKQPDPVGIPGLPIPEPLYVPDTKKTISICTFNLKDIAGYGFRNFKINTVNIELESMEAKAVMLLKKIRGQGNYTMSCWLTRAQGPFTIDMMNLTISTRGTLQVKQDGKIYAQSLQIDLKAEDIKVDLQNLGPAGNILQGIVNSVSTYIFDILKPLIIKEAYTRAKFEIDKLLKENAGKMQFPNSISPLDMAIAVARNKMVEYNMEPYKIKDYNTSLSIFTIALSHIGVTGICSFHRVGNITLKMENNTIIADFEIGTQKLKGTLAWKVTAVSGLISRSGSASFSVEYISGRIVLAQPMDTRQGLQFRDLELEVGNIQVRCDGAGTADYVIESVVNILPNLLRYQIVDAFERPLKEKAQLELNGINVEELIKQKLPEVDEIQKNGFKLSALLGNTNEEEEELKEVDDFFNF